jgi:hypothetical protein
MARRILIAGLAALLAVSSAEAAGRKAYKAAGFTSSVGLSRGMVFQASYLDPANPLAIAIGAGPLTSVRAHDATHTATYVHPTTGLVTVATDNLLRIESTGALIEDTRTNLALQSETLGTTWAPTTCTVAANQAVAPDGASTAESLTATAGNATLLQTVTGTAVPYTFSVYLKRKTGSGAVQVRADSTNWTTCAGVNASTWTRCVDTRTLSVAAYTPGIRIVTDTDAVYAWGGQMEAGAWASSYIGPTVAAAKIRNIDLLSVPRAGVVYDAGGTFAVTFDTTTVRANVPVWAGVLAIGADVFAALTAPTAITATDGVNYGSTAIAASPDPGQFRITRSWSGITWNGAADGVLATSEPYDGSWTNAAVDIGNRLGSPIWGHISNLIFWNRALTDNELKAVSR